MCFRSNYYTVTLFEKNCWKQRFYQISFIKSRFHLVFSLWEIFSCFSTLQFAIWVVFTTYLQMRNISFLQNTVLKNAHCGNYEILMPQFFANFPSNQRLLKNFTVNWFDERNFAWHGSEFLVFPHCTVWKFRKFSPIL